MKKELKDYAAFYLRCDVMTNEGEGKLVAVFSDERGVNELVSLEDGDPDAIEWVKPILRPLSDMTEEERIKKNSFNEDYNLSAWSPLLARAESFRYLLSKHFDLFNLIPAGLAIDQTTLI